MRQLVGHMSATADRHFLDEVISREGWVQLDRLSVVLRVSRGELATASGLSRSSVSKRDRLRAPATQTRLRQVAEIINRILPWCGSAQQAYAWYRSQPIPAFGDQTAEELVRQGRAEHVMSYLAGIAVGGYA
jgi:uncharacterized protein (DUF2384 family)